MDCLVGCDPEVFVKDMSTGKFISGDKLIPGTKEKPYVVDKGAIQVDGMALEFNIDPAKTVVEFVGNVIQVFNTLKNHVSLVNRSLSLVASPVVDFDPEYFEEVSIFAKQLGCHPDFSAYTLQPNDPPDGERPFRTASGHVHVGFTSGKTEDDTDHFMASAILVRYLDCYLGIPSLLYDGDRRRRELYGSLGAFRPKPYGLEYRVLSNAWLKDQRLIEYIYNQTRLAVDAWNEQRPLPFDEDLIQEMYLCKEEFSEHWLKQGLQEKGILLPPGVE